MKRSPAFKLTMKYAGLLGQASQVAAAVYRSLPKAQRKHALYRALTGQAMQLLKAGTEAAIATEQLKKQFAPVQQAIVVSTVEAAKTVTATTDAVATTTAVASGTAILAAATAPASPVLKRKAPSPNLQTKYARIFVHPSGRIGATGLADAIANKARRRLLASVEERE